MKTALKILFLSGFVGMMAYSLGQNNTVSYNLPTNDTVLAKTFPNQIGDSWTYSVFDSTTLTSQTVIVKIVGDTVFRNGEKFKIWEYRYPGKTDIGYVNVFGNTVKLNTKYGSLNTKYIFPLYKEKSWTSGHGIIHTSKVEKISTIKTPAGTFMDCYNIKTIIRLNNYLLKQDIWFKPNVGIVQKHIFEYNLGPPDRQLWKLKSYSLTNQK